MKARKKTYGPYGPIHPVEPLETELGEVEPGSILLFRSLPGIDMNGVQAMVIQGSTATSVAVSTNKSNQIEVQLPASMLPGDWVLEIRDSSKTNVAASVTFTIKAAL